MSSASISMNDMNRLWPAMKGFVSLPHTQKQYEKMVSFLDELIDEIGNNEKHVLASLMETIGTLIEAYEHQNLITPSKDSISILKSLMAEHNLKQKDMTEIGSQGVVSEILNGRRKLNLRQIAAVSKRFHVSVDVFI